MPIEELFSNRQRKLRGDVSDIFIYDDLPDALRVQINYIISDVVGKQLNSAANYPYHLYDEVCQTLKREYGLLRLTGGIDREDDPEKTIKTFIHTQRDVERVLDAVELIFRYIHNGAVSDEMYLHYTKIKMQPKEAIDELNTRFREHRVGYQFVDGKILRLDSTYAHSEMILPAITLLSSKTFDGPHSEYLLAHEHYRHGRNKACLVECGKAIESTMKVICSNKGWPFNPTDPFSKLSKVCFDNNLLPPYLENHYLQLKSLLDSGVPTLRNKAGAHGQGAIVTELEDETVRYALNVTAANIILLVELSGIK